jgi:hypothetical protein
VILRTPKGGFSKTAVVKEGQFRVDVDFSTLKSWSRVSGYHCTNLPSFVDIAIRNANRL